MTNINICDLTIYTSEKTGILLQMINEKRGRSVKTGTGAHPHTRTSHTMSRLLFSFFSAICLSIALL